MTSNQSEIVNFFTGKSIFITGASGFIGKALVYKLLKDCPKIGDIYILLRDKRGFNCDQRLNQILGNKCFDEIKSVNRDLLDKIKPISGDISMDGLGINENQRQLLSENVSIIIHSAATVKFNESLRESVNINLLGTRRMIKLAECLPKLKAFIHVSSCYSNCNLTTIENKIHPQQVDPEDLINCCNWMSDDMIDDILPKLLDKRPNTYTLTKALTETLIARESGSLPIAIIRPSIVTSAYREPFPGWIDNTNNVPGIAGAISLGVTRTMIGRHDVKIDLIPVDMVVNMIIATVWQLATNCDENDNQLNHKKLQSPNVLNCSSGEQNGLTMKEFADNLYNAIKAYPDPRAIRAPTFNLVTNKWFKNSILFGDQYIPYFLMDLISLLTGNKTNLIKICNKVNSMVESFEFFSSNGWTFDCSSMVKLFNSLNPTDQKLFNFNVKLINWTDYAVTIIIGLRQFTSKEGDKYNLYEAKNQMQRKINMERGIKMVLTLIAGSFAYKTTF